LPRGSNSATFPSSPQLSTPTVAAGLNHPLRDIGGHSYARNGEVLGYNGAEMPEMDAAAAAAAAAAASAVGEQVRTSQSASLNRCSSNNNSKRAHSEVEEMPPRRKRRAFDVVVMTGFSETSESLAAAGDGEEGGAERSGQLEREIEELLKQDARDQLVIKKLRLQLKLRHNAQVIAALEEQIRSNAPSDSG